MVTGLALVALLLLAVILLLLIDRAGLKAEAESVMKTQRDAIAAQKSLIDALRTSHDEVQDIALRALRGDFERRTDR